MTPEELQARLLYRDAMMLVIDKPAGIAVHAGSKANNHLGLYLDALTFGLPNPPELAHRLDRDTSGCLVLGRHRQALRKLGALFTQGRVEKVYWAVTKAQPDADAGVIDKPLAKVGPAWSWKVKVDEKGQPSVTEWRCLGRSSAGLAWIECRPKTGRTHQLRVHLASIGCPILGDRTYGTVEGDNPPPLHLHARSVSVPLYPKKPPVEATAPVPLHLRAALAACGWPGEPEPAKA